MMGNMKVEMTTKLIVLLISGFMVTQAVEGTDISEYFGGGYCEAGGPVQKLLDHVGSYLHIMLDMNFHCYGEVATWEYFVEYTRTFFATVWRPVPGNEWKLVGKNEITPSKIGPNHYEVPFNERIQFQPGDAIGIHVPDGGDGSLSIIDGNGECCGIPNELRSRIVNKNMKDGNLPIGQTVVEQISGVKRLIALKALGRPVNYRIGGAPQLLNSDPLLWGGILTSWPLPKAGVIHVWEYYAQKAGPFWMAIFAEINGQYVYKGKNRIVAPNAGRHRYVVPEDERISHEAGAFMGIFAETSQISIALSLTHTQRNPICCGVDESEFSPWLGIAERYSHHLVPGFAVTKTDPGAPVMYFAVQAISYKDSRITANPNHGHGALVEMKKNELEDGNIGTCIRINTGVTLKLDSSSLTASSVHVAIYTRGFECAGNRQVQVYSSVAANQDFYGQFEECSLDSSKVINVQERFVYGCNWICNCVANICTSSYVSIFSRMFELCEVKFDYVYQ
ncbi:unnamed protein product [Owenia fusiformis]|uniref:Uncharacterized protein n=1 Tax=Owenia fusiformis TaxID=6347 RepID=A0A8J1UYP5_OWEFU|nr:unnamed protein product [Owenia fusiformis]